MSSSIYTAILLLVVTVVCQGNDWNIGGTTADGWQFVRRLFRQNFLEQRDLGASIAVYHQGQLVVDLWGGWFDREYQQPYDNNTLQLVFSTTKGLVAVAAALCVQRGLLDYSALVTKYWPEYGQNGKENTTVADVLSHRAGLPVDSVSFEDYLNWTTMIHSLEQQRPRWPPGSAHGYHALTYGWLAGELVRRVDPKRRTLGQFIQEEIADVVAMEFYVGLPSEFESRVSPITLSLSDLQTMNETTQNVYGNFNDPRVHQAEIPAANGITNARSVARLYASLIGELDGGRRPRLLKESILNRAITSNTPTGEIDYIFQTPLSNFGMGFWLFDQTYPIQGSTAFGHAGNFDALLFSCAHSIGLIRSGWQFWFCRSREESFLRLCDESIQFSDHRWKQSSLRTNSPRNSQQNQLTTFDLGWLVLNYLYGGIALLVFQYFSNVFTGELSEENSEREFLKPSICFDAAVKFSTTIPSNLSTPWSVFVTPDN